MEILSIIPARGGSKGIKRKNLKPILGKPLVAYTIEASINSKSVNRTIVSSEDDEILEVSKSFGAETIRRPMELAKDTTKTPPVMLDVIERLEKEENYKPDYVVLLQPTCPLRDAKRIDEIFEFYFREMEKGYDSCFSVYDLGYTHSMWKMLHNNKMEALYDYRTRPRRQETQEHFRMLKEDGSFYALKTETMKEVKDFIGYNPVPFITDRVIDIDTIEDFDAVSEILKAQKNA